jgi:cytochrome P460
MRPKSALAIAVIALASVITYLVTASGHADEPPAPMHVTKIPTGYRDWRVISVAHEEGSLHSFAIVLGNDVAIKAYRDAKLPFPDGTVIAALHYSHIPSDENNKVFGQAQSFVPGPPTNIQFEVKNSKLYAATGGWGFGHFDKDGKPGGAALLKTCAPCHAMASRDFVFTQYAH